MAEYYPLYQQYAPEGLPPDTLRILAEIESNHRADAKNPWSSAGGLFQFTDSTADAYGLSGDARFDPEKATQAAARLASDNASYLRERLGREPTIGELYLAHQQGMGGATALLSKPGQNVVDALTPLYGSRSAAERVVRQNGGKLNQTAGQFASQWVSKAEKVQQRLPPGELPQVATQTDTRRPPVTGAPTPLPPMLAAQRTVASGGYSEPSADFMASIYPQPRTPSAPITDRNLIFDRGISDTIRNSQAQQDQGLAAQLAAYAAPKAPARPALAAADIYRGGGPTRPPSNQVGIAPTGRPILDNGDGSVSTERTMTVTDPRINGGKPTNIPTIWGGRQLSDEQAINTARVSGQNFTAFPSIAAAEAAAQYRSANEILPKDYAIPRAPAPSMRQPSASERSALAYVAPPQAPRVTTVASIPTTPQRAQLPSLPPSTVASPRMVETSMQRAAAAQDPRLAAALAPRPPTTPPRQPSASERSALAYVAPPRTPAAPRQPNAQERAALAYVSPPAPPANPRIGQLPATRVVQSVPAPSPRPTGSGLSRDSVQQASLGNDAVRRLGPTAFAPPSLPKPTLSALPQLVPGPVQVAQVGSQLGPGNWGVPGIQGLPTLPGQDFGVGTALSVVPGLPGFPPIPQRRPIRPSVPTPVSQRPTAPMPSAPRRSIFAMPTPTASRPTPTGVPLVTIRGAGSASGGSSSSSSSSPSSGFVHNGQQVYATPTKRYNTDTNSFETVTTYKPKK